MDRWSFTLADDESSRQVVASDCWRANDVATHGHLVVNRMQVASDRDEGKGMGEEIERGD